jgi:hypothetical protein
MSCPMLMEHARLPRAQSDAAISNWPRSMALNLRNQKVGTAAAKGMVQGLIQEFSRCRRRRAWH